MFVAFALVPRSVSGNEARISRFSYSLPTRARRGGECSPSFRAMSNAPWAAEP
jgi:hypothetical protein